ncbi:hypothetical protein [Methanoplanus endosymbiosus]|uniref:Uncharacterized protein n=1 Tax=Methanoplanus endosymbiosus TaxID=33865 RepID=A0A9E7TLS0_9EURY|nr:hypothetical protein [Methanoplanus endosymbiosus]UUX92656.1 hypothetical protein L6E24_00575 [Methanoplanus endosymbiosus]
MELGDGNLAESQNEGGLIQYTIEVSGIPKQAEIIEMDTDLIPVPEKDLWQFAEGEFNISGGEESLNDHNVELTAESGFPDKITVTVYGRVPVLTSVEIVDGVVVTRRITQTTGYIYYHIQALDENRDIIGTGTTKTFSITIPDDEQFMAQLNAVTDPEMREIIDDLYSRGLRDEAKGLLKYAKSPKEATLPFTTAVLIGVLMLIIGLGAGIIFGQIRAKNMQDFQKEYKEN